MVEQMRDVWAVVQAVVEMRAQCSIVVGPGVLPHWWYYRRVEFVQERGVVRRVHQRGC